MKLSASTHRMLFAMAMAGCVATACLHVSSFLGHDVTNVSTHLLVAAALFFLIVAGLITNFLMRNAARTMGISMPEPSTRRGLTRAEQNIQIVFFAYGLLACGYLWPGHDIVLRGCNLTIEEARALWPCYFAFFVALGAMALSSRRAALSILVP